MCFFMQKEFNVKCNLFIVNKSFKHNVFEQIHICNFTINVLSWYNSHNIYVYNFA